jgi:HPt (histidine-containing phosphotransfer) domain-containing protein
MASVQFLARAAMTDASRDEAAEREAARAALFSAELLRRVDAMSRAIEADALDVVASEANAIATGAMVLGLGALAEDAGRIEHAARQANRTLLSFAFVALQSGLHDTLAVLRRRG